ncbi:3-beta hydroxysteroid dehydrogenase/isomerase family-domain-containing protein [Clohesyomyces aquaticus]|uniref:Sterol-4-alpha-carboxylate 3-dehydrogenase ERG26, decarboxylating n=1 Tax=Clohesyomyces aquaticus TaxID=1231657 RepID=A0A1Y1ZGU4_9PLEO|nr:3-beta hydroxysteroid dehydrogenase/isomerase family-domain-containing protein [Clohesyomyces aquaticus]
MSSTEAPAPSLGKVLITGGCGFLGSHIVSLVVKRHPQTQIHVLDLRTSNNRHSSPTVSYHDGDITDAAALSAILLKIKPDSVIHTASPHFNLGKELHYQVNVEGTKNMVKAAQDAGVKAFIYTSSASVIYDPDVELNNADETWPMVAGDRQPEYYTSTKVWAETAVLSANRTPATFLTCAIRPAGIIGEGDVQILPKMVTALRKKQTKFQVGDNNNLFDFTYVENIAHGHLLALQALIHTHKILPTIPLDSERVDGEAFFITNGQPTYFWDFARYVWHEAGDTLPLSSVWHLSADFAHVIGAVLEWVFWVMGKTPNLTRQQVKYSTMKKYYSIDKAKRRLGYSPLVDLDEGVRRGVRFILEREAEEQQKKGQ